MLAEHLVANMGQRLVGREVFTERLGDYPGGFAVVTEIAPDPAAPDIACMVDHGSFGPIGIFGYEEIILVLEHEN